MDPAHPSTFGSLAQNSRIRMFRTQKESVLAISMLFSFVKMINIPFFLTSIFVKKKGVCYTLIVR